MLTERGGVGDADDLVKRVFDDADRQAGGDILDARAVLLRLFDGGVHENRAAGAEVDGPVREYALFGELLDGIAQSAREGLQKRPAAGGAGFVEEDVIDGAVSYTETFYVLTADVYDKIDFGVIFFRGGEVGYSLDDSHIDMEGVFDDLLAVARGG